MKKLTIHVPDDRVKQAIKHIRKLRGVKIKEEKALKRIPENLTNREQQVFKLILQGLSNVEIAKKLHIKRRTVDTHRHLLMIKTQARNAIGLAKYALKRGMFK